MDTMQRKPRRPRSRALDPERHDVDIDQHREVGRHDLQQMFEARSAQHSQHRLVHAALAHEIAAARRDQSLLLVLEPGEIMAEPLEHEMLKIEHPVASWASRRAQQPQSVGVAVEKVGMLAQISHDFAGTDVAQPRRRGAVAADRLRLVLRSVGHVYSRGAVPEHGPEKNTAAERCAIIREPPGI
jgi:hypothetical protein